MRLEIAPPYAIGSKWGPDSSCKKRLEELHNDAEREVLLKLLAEEEAKELPSKKEE
jgi:hypothetical protein